MAVQNSFFGGGGGGTPSPSGPQMTQSIPVVDVKTGDTIPHDLDGDVAIQFVDENNEFFGGFFAENNTGTTFDLVSPFGSTEVTGTIIAFKLN